MGLATAWQLSRRGARTLLLDQGGIPSGIGSSIGHTRLIRKAYFEHPDYVPLLERAYEHWAALEAESSASVFHRTGLLVSGPEHHPIMAGIRESASRHGLPTRTLAPAALPVSYPQFRHPRGHVAVFEPDGGLLRVEPGLAALRQCAEARGVTMMEFAKVTKWSADESGARVTTSKATFTAERLVLTAGSWMRDLLALPGVELVVRRAPLFWVDAPKEYDLEHGLPCFAFVMPNGFFYGFPSLDGAGLKVALHKGLQELDDLEDTAMELLPGDWEPVEAFLRACLPRVRPTIKSYAVCRYTMTVDEHFVIGLHPSSARVAFASPCSGHGFKFAPTIGEALADLALEGRTTLPIGFLAPERLL
jgi:sarcosine oxidase